MGDLKRPGASGRVYGDMPEEWAETMGAPSVKAPFCVVCGRASPLNQHHVVPRSRGSLWRDGKRLEAPTVTLCGMGNASGCHGAAHGMTLHLRYVDGWEWLRTDAPTSRRDALAMGGWRPIHEPQPWD